MNSKKKICSNFLSLKYLVFFTVQNMGYYQIYKKETLKKPKENYSKEKDAEYYLLNKEPIKNKDKK